MEKRRFIVLSGEKAQRFMVVKSLVNHLPAQQLLWFTQADLSLHVLTGTITHTIDQVLGREHDVVVFDAFSGFNPDAFAALTGTIKAGGVLILLCPALAIWHQMDDPFTQRITSWPYSRADVSGRFIQYFVAHIRQATFIEKVTFADVALIPDIVIKPSKLSEQNFLPTPNDEQQRVISAIKQTALSELPAVLVVAADRGRGKSAALGMAVAELLQLAQGKFAILVIAPTLKTVDVLFHHARLACNDEYTHAHLGFMAPDVALQKLPVADLVLIDEAAAIPATLLAGYLKHYPRIIFATTVQGYEGTGRGFALRFQQVLDQYCSQWQIIYLQQAIRYQAYDPLECFVFRSLLLGSIDTNTNTDTANNSHLIPSAIKTFRLDDCIIQRINRDDLLANPALLDTLFGLLVLAHYQTRPTDLRHLLDGKNVVIYAVFWQKTVIATCLMVKEGGFDRELAHAIYYGKRRPQGHLVAQSLAFHAGLADAPLLITQRVMRIVVHPDLQQRGIASQLLERIEQEIVASTNQANQISQKDAVDYLSTSFAATDMMLSFWHKQGFKAVHMGLKRDASSGCHSVIMLKPLSNKGRLLFAIAQQQFYRHFPVLLTEALQDVEQAIIEALLLERPHIDEKNEANEEDNSLSTLDKADLHSFAYGYRGYAFCLYAIRKLLRLPSVQTVYLAILSKQQQQLLQQRVIDELPIVTVVKTLRLSGKKALDKQLRHAIKRVLEQDHDYFFTG